MAATTTESTRAELPDATVTLRRRGEGAPVLFLHGSHFPGVWLEFHDRLAARADVVYPVHPGFEEGEPPDWLGGFDDLVLLYRDLLDALEIERAHVVGWALGGWLAAEFAVFCPHRLASLTLVSPLGLRVEGAPVADYLVGDPAGLGDLLFNGPDEALPDLDEPAEFARYYGEMGVTARLIWERRYDLKLERRLPRVRARTLLLWGGDDRVVPAAHAARWSELMPGARTETVSGAGHALLVQRPEVADVVAEHVSA